MWEKSQHGPMPEMAQGMGGGKMMMMMWEKLDDNTKKMLFSQMLDDRIFKTELKAKYLEHKIESLKKMKAWVEKM